MTRKKLAGIAIALMIGPGIPMSAYSQETTAAAEPAPQGTATNWLVTCSNQMDAARLDCSMSQSVVLAANGARLTTVIVQPTDVGYDLTLILPFGLDLQAGVQLVIDQVDWQKLPISTCEAGACYSAISLDAAAITKLSEGTALDVQLINRQGEAVTLGLTLAGFTASLELMN